MSRPVPLPSLLLPALEATLCTVPLAQHWMRILGTRSCFGPWLAYSKGWLGECGAHVSEAKHITRAWAVQAHALMSLSTQKSNRHETRGQQRGLVRDCAPATTAQSRKSDDALDADEHADREDPTTLKQRIPLLDAAASTSARKRHALTQSLLLRLRPRGVGRPPLPMPCPSG